MPNKVIEQVHSLAATAKEYEGILFIEINGILADQLMETMDSKTVRTNEQWPTVVERGDEESSSSAD